MHHQPRARQEKLRRKNGDAESDVREEKKREKESKAALKGHLLKRRVVRRHEAATKTNSILAVEKLKPRHTNVTAQPSTALTQRHGTASWNET